VDDFLVVMQKVAEESFRVLKQGKVCAVMIGDLRKYGKVVPLGFFSCWHMNTFSYSKNNLQRVKVLVVICHFYKYNRCIKVC
jgi:hypothetical protein